MTAKLLSTLPLFSGVPLPELKRLAKLCPIVEFQPRDIVFNQGDPSTHALLVITGALEASTLAGQRRTVLGHVRAGDLTGESGLMVLEEGRGATLTATHTVQALRITREHLQALTGTRVLAALQIQMLNATAFRLRGTSEKMQRHVRKMRREAEDHARATARATAAAAAPPTKPWRAFLDALGGLA